MRAEQDQSAAAAIASEDELALVMQWSTLPAKLQRELFDDAGTMGELFEHFYA